MHRTQIALCYGTRPQVIKAIHAAGIEPRLGSGLPNIVSALEPLVS
jgi:hypothetical protein